MYIPSKIKSNGLGEFNFKNSHSTTDVEFFDVVFDIFTWLLELL